MRIIAKRTLREFWNKHANAEASLAEWYTQADKAEWKSPTDITDSIANARYLGNQRFSFKVRGNRYRLVIEVNFTYQTLYIRFVGTHAEYDKIDVTTI